MLELIVKVFNVNYGKNKVLQNHCKTLEEYGIFVVRVRENIRKLKNNEDTRRIDKNLEGKYIRNLAIEKAIDECIKDGILVDFLESEREEVLDVGFSEIQFENDVADYIQSRKEYDYHLIKQEGIEEGLKQGLKQGQKQVIKKFFSK